jgi:hypothetical protein
MPAAAQRANETFPEAIAKTTNQYFVDLHAAPKSKT